MTSLPGLSWHALVSIGLCFLTARDVIAQAKPEALKDFRIDGLVRFHDPIEAEAARERLIHAIWPGGLPKTRPVTHDAAKNSDPLASLDANLIVSATRLDVNVSGFDWHANVYVVVPAADGRLGKKLAIVHCGHMPEGRANYLVFGLSETVNQLLRDGYVVAIMQMPLTAWNRDAEGVVDGRKIEVDQRSSLGHDELFSKVEPVLRAGTMRFFLEPVAQTVNELLADYPDPDQLLMIGLSGGGWATHLCAAVDPRIDVSIAVAGALPLYARPFSPGSSGDSEQEYRPIFGEEDSNNDGFLDRATGIASWLEVFALGGIPRTGGRPRKQIQVLNRFDSCCFNGDVYKTYAEPLEQLTGAINHGDWSIFIDDTHRDHVISPHVLKDVLSKAVVR
ncbi:MAG TPA: hypothetical protein VN634_05145 [Candidatus Limnocylindrales bacterium]|nr:hypothetical protein [Candidatus Limnocylindrales bacterium]